MRYFLLALVVCSLVVLSAVAVGRAIDQEIQDRIVFVRDGVTLDCERLVRADGSVGYDGCITVP